MNSKLLEYLGKAEGIEIHRNPTETDITTMFGIYRAVHPTAEVFILIDTIAKKIGISIDSTKWGTDELNQINSFINSNSEVKENVTDFIIAFYDDYLKNAHLELFHENCIVSMFSMFVNSPLLAWKSVQFAINTFISQGMIDNFPLVEDGSFGEKTKIASEKINEVIKKDYSSSLIFESNMLFAMSINYASLAKSNPDKYLPSLVGWGNRLKILISTK